MRGAKCLAMVAAICGGTAWAQQGFWNSWLMESGPLYSPGGIAISTVGGVENSFFAIPTAPNEATVYQAQWNGSSYAYHIVAGVGGSPSCTIGSTINAAVAAGHDPSGTVTDVYYIRKPDPNSPTTTEVLMHAWSTSFGSWTCETVENRIVSYGSSDHISTVNFNGQRHVFFGLIYGALSHAWFDTSWHLENIDGLTSTGPSGHGRLGNVGVGAMSGDGHGSLIAAVLWQGTPHVFYSQFWDYPSGNADANLRHGWWDGANWNFETLDGDGGLSGQSFDAIAGDIAAIVSAGVLHVFYRAQLSYDAVIGGTIVAAGTPVLRHAYYDTQWHLGYMVDDMRLPMTLPPSPGYPNGIYGPAGLTVQGWFGQPNYALGSLTSNTYAYRILKGHLDQTDAVETIRTADACPGCSGMPAASTYMWNPRTGGPGVILNYYLRSSPGAIPSIYRSTRVSWPP